MCKRVGSPYRPGRIWVQVRASTPQDAEVIGFTGPVVRPRTGLVQQPDGVVRFSRPLWRCRRMWQRMRGG